MLLAGKEIWVFNIKVCPGLEKTSLYFFVRNSATLVHELYLLLPLIPIQVNWAELQYWTQPMDRGEVFSVINSIFFLSWTTSLRALQYYWSFVMVTKTRWDTFYLFLG